MLTIIMAVGMMNKHIINGQPDAPKSVPTPGAQKSGQGVSLDLVEWRGTYQGTSNITALTALYSIKNRKFVKGYIKGCGGRGDIIYKVYPGVYVYFFYFSWSKCDPPREVKIELLRLEKQGEQTLSKAVIKFYNSDFLKSFPPQLLDFVKFVPSYHGYPSIDFNKIYSNEENKALLELINQGVEITEGAEHD